MAQQKNERLMEEFTLTSVMDKIDKIRCEYDECKENPSEENMKKMDELMWAQFMAGLRLSSGSLFS